MADTKELIEELRVQANQHPGDVDLLQFDIAATALEQLQARCEELERENLALLAESDDRVVRYIGDFARWVFDRGCMKAVYCVEPYIIRKIGRRPPNQDVRLNRKTK
jgi:hypothetical protein